MAVPTGEYEVEVSADLSPVFGKVVERMPLRVEQPGPDALDKAIARLRASDDETRSEAVDQLDWFPEDGDRIVPLLLEIIRKRDEHAIYSAIYSLQAFPGHAEQARPVLLELLEPEYRPSCAATLVIGELFPHAYRLCNVYNEAYGRAQFSLVEKAAKAIRRLLAD